MVSVEAAAAVHTARQYGHPAPATYTCRLFTLTEPCTLGCQRPVSATTAASAITTLSANDEMTLRRCSVLKGG